MKFTKKIILLYAVVTPFFASAANTVGLEQPAFNTNAQHIGDWLDTGTSFVNTLLAIVSAMAVLAFFYGLAKFVLHAGDSSKVQEGKDLMIWGSIGIFVLFSILSIINLLLGDFFGFALPG